MSAATAGDVKNRMFNKTILCIGAGYVGGPSMAVFACKCADYKFIVADINEDRIRAWNSEMLPIYEPGLHELVKTTRGKNLFFTTDIPAGIKESDIIFVSVNTPTKTFGAGAGRAADLQYVERAARLISEHADSDKIVVEKSTLPIKTAEAISAILHCNGAKKNSFQIISNPEFLAEGSAISDMENPDRVLIGAERTPAGARALEEVMAIYKRWVPQEKILTTSIWSSELSKLVANAFLAQRVSSINSITPICELTGACSEEVAGVIGQDSRIGRKFLKTSPGFGGSCFKKDILNLVYIAQSYGLTEVANYWEAVVKMNEYQENRFVDRMVRLMFNTIAGKHIALFGFAFKPGTSDTRESPAIQISRNLMEERAELFVTDPKAIPGARKDLASYEGQVRFTEDPYEAAYGAHAIALVTGWDEYGKLDYKKIYAGMKRPSFIFDGCNCLDSCALYDIGFNVISLGRREMIRP